MKKPLVQVTSEAINLLIKHLGLVDTLRFINQYTNGFGDYTEQREEMFRDMSLDDIITEIEKSRPAPE